MSSSYKWLKLFLIKISPTQPITTNQPPISFHDPPHSLCNANNPGNYENSKSTSFCLCFLKTLKLVSMGESIWSPSGLNKCCTIPDWIGWSNNFGLLVPRCLTVWHLFGVIGWNQNKEQNENIYSRYPKQGFMKRYMFKIAKLFQKGVFQIMSLGKEITERFGEWQMHKRKECMGGKQQGKHVASWTTLGTLRTLRWLGRKTHLGVKPSVIRQKPTRDEDFITRDNSEGWSKGSVELLNSKRLVKLPINHKKKPF